MSHLFAVALSQDRKSTPQTEPKPTTVGQYQEAKPMPGVVTEEICGGALFPSFAGWPFNKKWKIKPDPIPPAIDDHNRQEVVSTSNRIGGQVIRHHNPQLGNSFLVNLFYRVGVTEFFHSIKGTQITPGVNLWGGSEGTFGSNTLSVGAQQGTIAQTIGEESDIFTPANQFAVKSAFILPDKEKELDGLLVLGVQRTVFPHLCLQYRLWNTDCSPLANIALSFAPSFRNPLSLALPMEQTLLFYRLRPGIGAEPIEFEEARTLKRQHKQQGVTNDEISSTLSSLKRLEDMAKRLTL